MRINFLQVIHPTLGVGKEQRINKALKICTIARSDNRWGISHQIICLHGSDNETK